VTTFIPYEFGLPGKPFVIPGDPPLPVIAVGAGDNRGFNPIHPSYRTRQTVSVSTDTDSIIVSGPINDSSPSKVFIIDIFGNTEPIPLEPIPSVANMQVIASRVDKDTIRVTMGGTARSGAIPASSGLAIDWCYEIFINNPADGNPTYTILGGNDDYPAYEAYVNNRQIHGHLPPRNDLDLLKGGCFDVPVNKKSGPILP
jgi:hypothetical protein